MPRKLLVVAVVILSLCAVAARAQQDQTGSLLKKAAAGAVSTRIHAIDALGERGAPTPEMLDAMRSLLSDPSAVVRSHAARAIGRWGAASRPIVASLAPLVADQDPKVRRTAIRAWTRIAPGPDVSIPLLSKVMKNADPAVRGEVLNIFAEMGKQAVPSLVQWLKNDEGSYWACLVLGEIGPDAAEAVPNLIEVLDVRDRPELRREAALALGAIGPAAAPAVPALAKLLGDEDIGAAAGAAYALGRLGPTAKDAVPALDRSAARSDLLLRTISAWALAKIEPQAEKRQRDAIALLAAALGSKQPQARRAAARGLADLKPSPELVIPAIKDALRNADRETARNALTALASLGEPAVPTLIESLQYDDVRPAVARILGHIGPRAKQAVPALLKIAAEDKNPAARCEALMAVAAIGPTPETVPVAVEALQSPREDLAYVACYTLGRAGKLAESAVPELRKIVSDEKAATAKAAAWALAMIEPTSPEIAAEAVPLLIKGLAEPEPRIRAAAARALGKFGPLASSAAPELEKSLRDKDEVVRDAAKQALKAIQR